MPPHQAAIKATRLLRRRFDEAHRRRRDRSLPTYADPACIPDEPLVRYFEPVDVALLEPRCGIISRLAELGLEHRFDLLGSGWVQVEHGMKCDGLEGKVYPAGERVTADADGRWLAERINRANARHAQSIWKLVNRDYVPIDWQLDFKSGYRWSESTWSKKIRYGDKPGADVKVPWELARMQHLPQLAWAYALLKGKRGASTKGERGASAPCSLQQSTHSLQQSTHSLQQPTHSLRQSTHSSQQPTHSPQQPAYAGRSPGAFKNPDVYLREFCNQVLDFVATNPPRFGVNWCCTMDVGIRAANWLVAYDLFRAYGVEFDDAFERCFHQSVYEHGLHITNHLEWTAALRSNHYLADIAGLLFVAAYLPRTRETDGWLEFSVRELVHETGLQFHEDGSNFEASTSYHRLSAEMVLYAMALVLALPDDKFQVLDDSSAGGKQFHDNPLHEDPQAPALKFSRVSGFDRPVPFPDWYLERVERMVEFTRVVTRPDGRITQIGDNDSGRFLKMWPSFLEDSEIVSVPREDHLDHSHLAAVFDGLRTGVAGPCLDSPEKSPGKTAVETELIRKLIRQSSVSSFLSLRDPALQAGPPAGGTTDLSLVPHDAAEVRSFPDFGVSCFRNGVFHLTFRCGCLGQNGNGGHAHNDQLSIEICINGVPVFVDAGSYLYTPSPGERNRFRSTGMHNTLSIPGREQNSWRGLGTLFALPDRAQARVVRCTANEIVAEHTGFGAAHRRTVQIHETRIAGVDECALDVEKTLRFHLAPGLIAREDAEGITIQAGKTWVSLHSDVGRWSIERSAFSPGYGEIVTSQMCCLRAIEASIAWQIEAVATTSGPADGKSR